MPNNSLQITSYNCRGLPKSSAAISLRNDLVSLFSNNDIVCLQETWFFKQDLSSLNSLHDDFVGLGTATVDLCDGLCLGHAPGGVAILYRKSISPAVEPMTVMLDWCIGITITVDNKQLTILTIYLPYQCSENEMEYFDKLGQLSAIIEDMRTSSFLIIGDWNANLGGTGQNMFAKLMKEFCQDHSLLISSELLLPKDTFSFISDSWGTKTWLDHAVSSHDLHASISDICMGYDLAQEDHMPILLTLKVDELPTIVEDIGGKVKLQWNRFDSDDLLRYSDLTDKYLRELVVLEGAKCHDVTCDNPRHIQEVENFYDDVTDLLIKAGNEAFLEKNMQSHPCGKPGWNQYVKDLYDQSREMFLAWKSSGMPREGPVYDAHIKAKLRCKKAIRFIKRYENELRRQSLATKLAGMDLKGF